MDPVFHPTYVCVCTCMCIKEERGERGRKKSVYVCRMYTHIYVFVYVDICMGMDIVFYICIDLQTDFYTYKYMCMLECVHKYALAIHG